MSSSFKITVNPTSQDIFGVFIYSVDKNTQMTVLKQLLRSVLEEMFSLKILIRHAIEFTSWPSHCSRVFQSSFQICCSAFAISRQLICKLVYALLLGRLSKLNSLETIRATKIEQESTLRTLELLEHKWKFQPETWSPLQNTVFNKMHNQLIHFNALCLFVEFLLPIKISDCTLVRYLWN